MSVRIDRVYTKTGDQGDTALVGGVRVGKNHARIEAYGTVDELNAFIGLCRAQTTILQGPRQLLDEVDGELGTIQQDLFNAGADLATPLTELEKKGGQRKHPIEAKLKEERIAALERSMDRWQEHLAPLKSFVLPAGNLLTTHLHVARAVCRRAERLTVALAREEGERVLGPVLVYLNRLSDFLFVLSRFVSAQMGEDETLWKY